MCDKSFEADLPDRIDLDSDGSWLEAILDGSFFSVTCPHCGTTLKPDLEVRLVSERDGIDYYVIPDLQRLSFYIGKVDIPAGSEVLIGFPEVLERFRIIKAGLDPLPVEYIKLMLLSKASETNDNDSLLTIHFVNKENGSLVFHVRGLREDEVAVLKVPEKNYTDLHQRLSELSRQSPYASIAKGPYKSLRILEAAEDDE
jgi:hypothetical protein